MSSKQIRVSEDVYAQLVAQKGEDESFSDVIERLLALRRAEVEEGAGLWSGTNAAEEAHRARRSMKEDVGGK